LGLALLLALAAAGGASAERLEPSEVPEPLRPWVEWALGDAGTALCPALEARSQRICQWPGRLALDLGETGGEFRLEVHADRRGAFALPGGPVGWPEDVRVDGRPAAVVEKADSPSVELEAGSHEVRGRFVWPRLPALLRVPPELGLVSLRLAGGPVTFPARDGVGRLWLRAGPEEASAGERRIDLEVHRKVTDEVPLELETRVALQVSGPGREERIGPALPPGFVPLGLVSPLPARIEPDGRLRVQVRAGRHELLLRARHVGPVESLAAPPLGEGSLWPASEVWVFEARPALRLVTVEGVAVDPQQTSLPGEWRALPAYRLEPGGSALRFVERRRGDAEPAPDELHLSRRFSLDFDGGGATVSDRLTGAVHARRRLEMGPGTELGRAAVNGVDQFLTRLGDAAQPGIQVSPGTVQVDADSRVAGSARALPAVGWAQDVASLAATLELPPGYELVHASGVDRARWTWLNRWTLLDLFVALVVAVAFLRLYGPGFGALAALALALTTTEPGAPRWVWVAVLAVEALRRAVPEGSFARTLLAARVLALSALVALAVPFAVAALRAGLYPALAQPGPQPLLEARVAEEAADASLALPEEAPAAPEPARRPSGKVRRYVDVDRLSQGTAPAEEARAALPKIDPNARITTGPGIPTWSWRRVDLEWSGPVEKDAVLRLVLLPPWGSAFLAVLRALLLGALVARVLGVRLARPVLPGVPGAAIALLALPLLGAPARAAEFPPQELLDALRERLTETPACTPACAAIATLRVDARGDRLQLSLDVSAAAATAVPLPGNASSWLPSDVRVGGTPARALLRDPEGTLWLRLAPGSHAIELDGPLPPGASVALPLPLAPHRAEARLEGWTLEGIRPDGSTEPTLQLVRAAAAPGAGAGAEEAPELPPFVRVRRSLLLGLTWEVRSEVERLSPPEAALVVEIPLLAGESVTTPGVEVREGRARIALAPGAARAAFASHLAIAGEIALRAPEDVPWTEAWELSASPIWHLSPQGLAPVQADAAGGRGADLAWRPWPGESVRIGVARPEGVGGATLTLDGSQLALRPGLRSTDAALSLALRSSQGGEHRVTLPEGATLQRVAVDGAELPLRQEGRAVVLPVRPGTQRVELGWREASGIGAFWRAAPVDLGAPSVNAETSVEPPAGRWLLFVSGPPLGPAVLFWPVLVAYLGLAVALGRVRGTPLRTRQWALLAVGLTQVGVVGAATVALWLLALGARGEYGPRVRQPWFNLMQLALAALTLAAFAALFEAIRAGLLGQPDMQIAGNASHAGLLRWYQDRSEALLPRPRIVSLPLLVYRLAMLAWALWIAQALVGWLRFGWRAFSTGDLWLPFRRPAAPSDVQ